MWVDGGGSEEYRFLDSWFNWRENRDKGGYYGA